MLVMHLVALFFVWHRVLFRAEAGGQGRRAGLRLSSLDSRGRRLSRQVERRGRDALRDERARGPPRPLPQREHGRRRRNVLRGLGQGTAGTGMDGGAGAWGAVTRQGTTVRTATMAQRSHALHMLLMRRLLVHM